MSEVDVFQVAPELGIPEVRPAIESIRGRWERKVSPKTRHAILQARLSGWLTLWARDRGEVGTEWRFYMLPEGDKPSSLVPDVAYVSSERMPPRVGELREKPTIAPDIAVEVLSPFDRRSSLREKISIYFEQGCRLVVVADPDSRTVAMRERDGESVFREGETAMSSSYPDLRLDVAALFKSI